MPRSQSFSRTSLALANLRAVTILIVIAFHSVLAYLQWNPFAGSGFQKPPYDWRSFPIVDAHRFFGFDLFCAWQDVYLMSLFFLLSGLFVWPSLKRKNTVGFLHDRLIRLGLPYVFGIAVIMPIAFYPVYRLSASDPSVTAYWQALLELPFWPNGPLWFLWQLLALNFLAAALYAAAPAAVAALGRWSAGAQNYLWRYFAVLIAVSAAAYVPLALAFTPWAWSETGLFPMQFCRPLLYTVYFFAGVGIGAAGIERGLVAVDGILPRHWSAFLAAALASLVLWMALTALTMDGDAPLPVELGADFSFVLACATGSFFLIAASMHFANKRWRIFDLLSENAYGLFVVHYVFVVWLQYALLDTPFFGVIKGTAVFAGTLALSLVTIIAVRRIPLAARLVGAVPRIVAAS
jgi:surface polysaccharide O-acyltransferase-like enzyme